MPVWDTQWRVIKVISPLEARTPWQVLNYTLRLLPLIHFSPGGRSPDGIMCIWDNPVLGWMWIVWMLVQTGVHVSWFGVVGILLLIMSTNRNCMLWLLHQNTLLSPEPAFFRLPNQEEGNGSTRMIWVAILVAINGERTGTTNTPLISHACRRCWYYDYHNSTIRMKEAQMQTSESLIATSRLLYDLSDFQCISQLLFFIFVRSSRYSGSIRVRTHSRILTHARFSKFGGRNSSFWVNFEL